MEMAENSSSFILENDSFSSSASVASNDSLGNIETFSSGKDLEKQRDDSPGNYDNTCLGKFSSSVYWICDFLQLSTVKYSTY